MKPDSFRVGNPVVVTDDLGNQFRSVVRTGPWQLGNREWVIAVEGMQGGCLLSRVRHADSATKSLPHFRDRSKPRYTVSQLKYIP